MKVLVLGGTGMLGSMVVDVFSRVDDIALRATYRGDSVAHQLDRLARLEWVRFDAEVDDPMLLLSDESWIINAIGIIKPLIRENQAADVRHAVVINSLFPYALAAAAAQRGARVIQIATDCVFSGRDGIYREDALHDPLDVYGKSKSLGEVDDTHFLNLRCSIVGPELRGHRSLLDWFRSQPPNATVRGFVNHRWNGVTTLHFAQVALGLLRSGSNLSGTRHLVPADAVTKADLLREFASAFGRTDLAIEDGEAPESIDRTLATVNPSVNVELWRGSGRNAVPTIRLMIQELATQCLRDRAREATS